MQRYALLQYLQRQRQLMRRMAPGQPLIAYAARHRQLAAAIGPMPEPPASTPLSRRALPGEEARFARPADADLSSLEQPVLQAEENEPEAPALRDLAPETAQKTVKRSRSNPAFVESRRAPSLAHASRTAAKSADLPVHDLLAAGEEMTVEQAPWPEAQSAEAEPIQPEPIMNAQNARELRAFSAEPKHDEQPEHWSSASQPGERQGDTPVAEANPTTSQADEHPASQPGQPGRRRARIEELPLPAPSASPAQGQRSSAGTIQRSEASHHVAQAEQKTEAQTKAESEAAELFTSNAPGRSPQEWFALLTQGERKKQNEASTATENGATNNETMRRNEAMAGIAATRYVKGTQGPRITNQSLPLKPVSRSGDARHRRAAPLPGDAGPRADTDAGDARPGAAPAVEGIPSGDVRHHRAGPGDAGADAGLVVENAPAAKGAASGEDTPAAEPVSMRARRVLKPLVGFDPADARVHRGPAAARFASARQADAVTLGDDIFLAAGHASDEPETLGLLAHELTHVARHHEPRFVPPVANGRGGPATPAQAVPAEIAQETDARSNESLATADEEALAGRVERQVTLRATEAADTSIASSPTRATQAFASPNTRENGPQHSQKTQSSWGGLPAPWEPLPDWLAPSSPAQANGNDLFASLPQAGQPVSSPSVRGGRSDQASVSSASTPGGAGASAGSGQAASAAQNASLGRSQAHGFAGAQSCEQGQSLERQREPEPDLDKLARQVYAVLKRRLDVEHRRIS